MPERDQRRSSSASVQRPPPSPAETSLSQTRSRPHRASSTSSISTSTAVDAIVTGTTTWHSIPLAFAVLPAVGGALFHNGSAVVTDVMLLLLAAVFLHWLVKFPWEWYNSSQVLVCEDPSTTAVMEEEAADPVRRAAREEMMRNETTALTCCFLGPLVGGWILHAVRAQLSRPSEGLVSDFNLTIFVLAAELRPTAQVVKLMRERTMHLQRLVNRTPIGRVEEVEGKVEALEEEVRELGRLARRMVGREGDLDALNRAVRRYEKKEALQSAQTETRILEINHRLALAAATNAKMQYHHYTLSAMLFDCAYGMMLVPFSITWKLFSLPVRAGRMVLQDSAGGVTQRRRLK